MKGSFVFLHSNSYIFKDFSVGFLLKLTFFFL